MEIYITAKNSSETLTQLQDYLGGHVEERWGEHILRINNTKAKGAIRAITFERGVNLLEYNITFQEEITLVMDTSRYNPIHFAYCLEGFCEHRFELHHQRRRVEQFQSAIITSTNEGYNYGYLPKEVKLQINVIQIMRKEFLKKKLNQVSLLNQQLYATLTDTDHQKAFAYFSTYNLKMADMIRTLYDIKQEGIIEMLQTEGLLYQILSLHIQQYDRETKDRRIETTLLQRELKMIQRLAHDISKDPAKPYILETLALESGITQAKLQEGFKLLYAKTVNEYIRHIRLEAAYNYMVTTDMNISEIVYAIGFSSRSYFSKIFRNKYGISPTGFKKKQVKTIKEAV